MRISPAMLLLSASITLSACSDSNSTNQSSTDGTATNTSEGGGEAATTVSGFPKSTEVFGIRILATSNTPDTKILHAARVMAGYLDNNNDGSPDNQQVVDAMTTRKATLVMAATEAELESHIGVLESGELEGEFQDLYASETHPGGAARGVFDASLEEVLHLITHVGYANVYPDVFGERVDSVIANAMDTARGGRFATVPTAYPSGAWYSYDDTTCDYACQVTEYFYWALTSMLGAQNFAGRLADIQQEWRLDTADKVRDSDPAVFSLLSDPQYALPSSLPDGSYSVTEFVVHNSATDADSDTSGSGTDTDSTDFDAVTGEFHLIQPGEVDAYVAAYESQRSRVAFTFDGTEHPLTFEDIDTENNQLFVGYENYLLVIGFDFESDTPLPSLAQFQLDGEEIANQWTGADLSISSAGEDIVYSGRLTENLTNEEFDVTLVINESLIGGGSSSLTVNGTDATLNGDLGTSTYAQIRNLIAEHPEVTRLVLEEISGSVNDAINVHTGRLVRAAGIATHVPSHGDVNSGGVDLFAAGATRSVDEGGILGVHSWCCKDGVTADKLPTSDPAHGTQLTYYREMLDEQGESFYFFTLTAAPFDGIHPMTREEMKRFGLISE